MVRIKYKDSFQRFNLFEVFKNKSMFMVNKRVNKIKL